MPLPNPLTFEVCPKCGSDDGFYTVERASGSVIRNFTFDRTHSDNTEMYKGVRTQTPKTVRCLTCRKRIGKWDDKISEEFYLMQRKVPQKA